MEQTNTCDLRALIRLVVISYEGETSEGQYDGKGVASFEGGHIYKGMFHKGLMHGSGVFTQAAGVKYEGEFVCNMPMGKGTYTWPDGSSYIGEVYNGIRHGVGIYKCNRKGVLYNGQWHHGKRHGKGTLYYTKDKTSWYKGDWLNNNKEGWGERRYPSGNIYSGEWKNNLRHGEGTMKWLTEGEQYVGTWQNGVQHGKGTHVWLLMGGSQYKGSFVDGLRHGQGAILYADGAMYEGEWKTNKRHGQGKFTFKDRRVFEGQFEDDKMTIQNFKSAFPQSDDDLNDQEDLPLYIRNLLDQLPEEKVNAECEQVGPLRTSLDYCHFCCRVGIHWCVCPELKTIYSFYSRLSDASSPDNTYMLTRLQFWQFLKDCRIHHYDITLTQIDCVMGEDTDPAEIHSPFTPVLFHNLHNCLVYVAHHIYSKDMMSQKNILGVCLSKLMTDVILPNAKKIKGFLFGQPGFTLVAMKYLKKCWDVYQTHSRNNADSRDDRTMTCRQLLWMLKDLHLLDESLTTKNVLEIIAAESCDPSNLLSCLDLEITFLEFFEALLGCAEVKCQRSPKNMEDDCNESRSDTEDGTNLSVDTSEELIQKDNSPKQLSTEDVGSEVAKTNSHTTPQFAGKTEQESGERKDEKICGMESTDREPGSRVEIIHQFFNHIFFPACDYYQEVTKNMKEATRLSHDHDQL